MLASVKFIRIFAISNTVRLVQLVEHQIVVLGVVGSSPTSHPSCEGGHFLTTLNSFLMVSPINQNFRYLCQFRKSNIGK